MLKQELLESFHEALLYLQWMYISSYLSQSLRLVYIDLNQCEDWKMYFYKMVSMHYYKSPWQHFHPWMQHAYMDKSDV